MQIRIAKPRADLRNTSAGRDEEDSTYARSEGFATFRMAASARDAIVPLDSPNSTTKATAVEVLSMG